MKKIFNVLMAVAATILVAASCTKESEGLTMVTYYPVIELEGDSYMIIDKGSTFVEPGYSAILNGEDVTSEVSVNSNVDTSTSGVYTVTYSATNEDGFSANETRTVVVLDPNDPVEGFYMTDPASDRNGTAYGRSFEILIIGEGDGVYYVEDLLGGWYCQRAGYGSNYAMQAYIEIAEDGSAVLLNSYVPGWGDRANSFSGSFDFSTGTLSYTVVYANTLNFNVVMTKE